MPSDRARELARQLVAQANLLLDQAGQPDEPSPPSEGRLHSYTRPRGWVRAPGVVLFMNVAAVGSATAALALVFGTGPPPWAGYGGMLLRLGVAWALAYVPAWIILRFLTERLPVIWDSFVEQLHRLGLDHPGSLPEPRPGSSYYAAWLADSGPSRRAQPNIYATKFNAYYGGSHSRAAMERLHRLPLATLLPVFALTTVLAVGWTAILWQAAPLNISASTAPPWVSLGAAFVGLYAVELQNLVRRFVSDDLRIGASISFLARLTVVLMLAGVLHAVFNYLGTDVLAVVMIGLALGLFSGSGGAWLLQLLYRVLAGVLRSSVPSISPAHPLSDLDGMNVWYEARLLEEGIEDLQSLVTAKVVDVILHTQVPVPRLLDWIDQAILLIHLDTASKSRERLRQVGVRSSGDLLKVFPPAELESRAAQSTSTRRALDALVRLGFDEGALHALVREVANQPAYRMVDHWRTEQSMASPIDVRTGTQPSTS
jgi:hypothetical protein